MPVPAGREIPLRRRTVLGASGFPALTALVVVTCIGVVGALYVRSERRLLRDQAEAQLAAIADLKVSQIETWRAERLADGQAFSRLFAPRLAALRDRPSALQSELGATLRLMTASYGYADVLVVDPRGRPLATAGEAEPPPEAEAVQRLATALKEGALIFEVPGAGASGLQLHVVAPIFDPDRPGVALGALVLRVDPRHDLFPVVKRWPTPSATGESLLVRIEGGHVVALNEPRHRSAAPYALPLDDPRYPTVHIVRGQQGLIRGTDYRGEEVLAVGRAVPRSAWFVVAKVDLRELMAPAREWTIALGGLVLLLIGSGVAALALWWRHQAALGDRARFLEEQRYHAAKMEAMGQLASGVAHDFNNLLVAILSCSELLLESIEPSDPRRTDVEEIRQAGQRAAHLVKQLLTFARKTAAGGSRGTEEELRGASEAVPRPAASPATDRA